MSARRYTTGKIRYELIPANFLKELAKVYTIGADKYTIRNDEGDIIDDGADNWRKGLSWKQTLGSIYRHLEKFKKGEDFDYDYPDKYIQQYGPTYHLANAAWGIAALLEYYNTHPELDDRNHNYLNKKRIGIDIDECIADFTGAYAAKTGSSAKPTHWAYCDNMLNNFRKWQLDGTIDDFYTAIKPLIEGDKLGFEPICYITSRPVESSVTRKWVIKHGFPQVPIYTTNSSEEKVEVAKQQKLDIFIDDNMSTFVKMNQSGICCFLMDAPHNRQYEVGYKRIKGFDDFKKRFL